MNAATLPAKMTDADALALIPSEEWFRIGGHVVALSNRGDEDNHVLRVQAWDEAKPLLIVVHPGDITEVDVSPEVFARSISFQEKLATKINHWDGEIVILHRFSCFEYFTRSGRASEKLSKALAVAHRRAIVIAYGDDLEGFVKTVTPCLFGRPNILVGGAYRDPESGCIDAVARYAAAVCPAIEIDPDAYTAP